MILRQLFHVKNVSKKIKNQHFEIGRTEFLVTIVELLHFTYLYQ